MSAPDNANRAKLNPGRYAAIRRAITQPDLSPGARIALANLLAWWMEDGTAWRDQSLLAEDCGISTRQLRRALNELTVGGYLVKASGHGRSRSPRYRLNPSDWSSGLDPHRTATK